MVYFILIFLLCVFFYFQNWLHIATYMYVIFILSRGNYVIMNNFRKPKSLLFSELRYHLKAILLSLTTAVMYELNYKI